MSTIKITINYTSLCSRGVANYLYFSSILYTYTYHCAQYVTRCIWCLYYHLHVILGEHYYYLIAHNIINVYHILAVHGRVCHCYHFSSWWLTSLSSRWLVQIPLLFLTPPTSRGWFAVIDSLRTLIKSRQKILQESLRDLLQSIGASLDNSAGVTTLSGDVCTTLST